jgi:hypothetical protein
MKNEQHMVCIRTDNFHVRSYILREQGQEKLTCQTCNGLGTVKGATAFEICPDCRDGQPK